MEKREPFEFSTRVMISPLFLLFYSLFFSLAYVQLSSGTGALILFATVQFTMMAFAFSKGQRWTRRQSAGVFLAASGFIYLLLPSLSRPPLGSTFLMMMAGVSWGAYSILGQSSNDPSLSTSRNFLLNLPIAIILAFIFSLRLTLHGALLASLSGAVTSGFGYILWYKVLKELKTSTAAIVQLSVPAIAGFGGVLFLGEAFHLRLGIASLLIFLGIFLKIERAQ